MKAAIYLLYKRALHLLGLAPYRELWVMRSRLDRVNQRSLRLGRRLARLKRDLRLARQKAETMRSSRAEGMHPEFVHLGDQQQLSDDEAALAQRICEYARDLVNSRSAYVSAQHMDPDIYLPMANWSLDSPLYEGYRRVATADREVLNNLRLFSQMFTGYRLADLQDSSGTAILDSVPSNLDSRLRDRSRVTDAWVDQYKKVARGLPRPLTTGPPKRFGEIGWVVNGTIVNHDTYVYLERLALLYEGGLIDPSKTGSLISKSRVTVLEIGAGYGGLAYLLRQLLPAARYIVVDIPESLIFSAVYLSVLFPSLNNQYLSPSACDVAIADDAGFSFVPNYMFPHLCGTGVKADLVINTLSMSEMSEDQVRDYCGGICELIGDNGVFFEQNQDNRHMGLLNASDIIAGFFDDRVVLNGTMARGTTQGKAHLWRAPRPSGTSKRTPCHPPLGARP